MFGVGGHTITKIGREDQRLIGPLSNPVDTHSNEGRILYMNDDFFVRCDKIGGPIVIFAQNRRKEFNEFLTGDTRTFMPPASILSDFHADIAAVFRIPEMNRRQTAFAFRVRKDSLQCLIEHINTCLWGHQNVAPAYSRV